MIFFLVWIVDDVRGKREISESTENPCFDYAKLLEVERKNFNWSASDNETAFMISFSLLFFLFFVNLYDFLSLSTFIVSDGAQIC